MSRAHPRFTRVNPPLPAPASNLYRIAIIGNIENQLTINTFYYLDARTIGSLVNFTALGTAFQTGIDALFKAAVSADWSQVGFKIDSPNNPLVQPLIYFQAAFGGGPAGHEPTTVSGTIIRYTNTKGQSGRGRLALPAVPSVWVTSSTITATAGSAAYVNFANGLTATLAVSADTLTPALMSRPPKTKILGAAQLTNAVAKLLLGTTRRRKIGRGK